MWEIVNVFFSAGDLVYLFVCLPSYSSCQIKVFQSEEIGGRRFRVPFYKQWAASCQKKNPPKKHQSGTRWIHSFLWRKKNIIFFFPIQPNSFTICIAQGCSNCHQQQGCWFEIPIPYHLAMSSTHVPREPLRQGQMRASCKAHAVPQSSWWPAAMQVCVLVC